MIDEAGIRKAVVTIIIKAGILRIALHHRAIELREKLGEWIKEEEKAVREERELVPYLRKELETHFPQMLFWILH